MGEPEGAKDRMLRVATYNVHMWRDAKGLTDPSRAERVLREIDADVVALQEVVYAPHNDLSQVSDILSAELKMEPIPGPTFIRGGAPYGNILLTRLPVLWVERHDISWLSFEPRGVIEAAVETECGPLRVIATHLGLIPVERALQGLSLNRIAQQARELPTVLLGDLNEWLPPSISLRRLGAWFGCTPGLRTYPAFFPLLRLDRIWARPNQMLRSLRVHNTQAARLASDHLPVAAEIDLCAISSQDPLQQHFPCASPATP
jgi:endonuclease/exonuclease/phosphatase family metal-dependent hydrolase